MNFLYPNFLWALSLIAIPIIIHLFNFRKYKTIQFSDIRMLEEVNQETRKRSNLKHILILISRILAISALVLAFAQPYLPGKDGMVKQGTSVVSIYLDNSFSMESEGSEGSLLEIGRQMAVEIADKFDETTQFQLLTSEFAGYQQRLINKEELLNRVAETKISPDSRSLPDIYRRQAEVLRNSDAKNKLAFVISDFQTRMFDGEVPNDSLENLNAIVLVASNQGNIYVDSLWFETPVRQLNNPEILKFRVINTTDKAVSPAVSVEINGNRNPVSVSIEGSSSTIAEHHFVNNTVGLQKGLITIRASDKQIRYDDSLFFSYNVLKTLNVLEITNQVRSPFTNIFGNDESYSYKHVSDRSVDLSEIDAQNLLILNGLNEVPSGLAARITTFVKSGGSLAVFPGTDVDFNSYRNFLGNMGTNSYSNLDTTNINVKSINIDHIFFQNVFEEYDPRLNLPKSYSRYRISGTYSSGEEKLFTNFDNTGFINHYDIGNGHVYLSSVPLDDQFTNLLKHGLFVPAVLRMAELSFPTNDLYYTIGDDNTPTIPNQGYNAEITFKLKNGDTEIIPLDDRTKPGVINLLTSFGSDDSYMLKKAGVYELSHDDRTIATLSYNYDRNESVRAFTQSGDEVKDYYENYRIKGFSVQTPESIEEVADSIGAAKPTSYWKICLILALIFLAFEVALVKLWKS